MQRLGGADAVENLEREAPLEAFEERRRQRLAGGDGDANARQIEVARVVSGARVCEQHAVAGRDRIEDRRPMALDRRVHVRGLRRAGREDRRGAHGERKEQRVAETVGEKQLGDAERAIVLGDAEHPLADERSRDTTMSWCRCTHPFGAPVLPDEYAQNAASSRLVGSAYRSGDPAASRRSKAIDSPSRALPTTTTCRRRRNSARGMRSMAGRSASLTTRTVARVSFNR